MRRLILTILAIFFIFLLLIGFYLFEIIGYVVLDPPSVESGCQNLNVSGNFVLNKDIYNDRDICFNISASNVVLDCNGHSINNNMAVYAKDVSDIEIKNCIFNTNLEDKSVFFQEVSSSAILDNSFNASSVGIEIEEGNNNQITNNVFSEVDIGIIINESCDNIINNNELTNSGVELIKACDNTLNNNIINWINLIGAYNNELQFGYIDNSDESNCAVSISDLGISSSDNIFRDLSINGPDCIINIRKNEYGNVNNIFLNVSYNNSKESVEEGNELIRKGYYRAFVNTSLGNSVENANILIYDENNFLILNLTSGSNGYTGIGTLKEYSNTGIREYYNYSVFASNTSHSSDHSINFTGNYEDYFTFNISITQVVEVEAKVKKSTSKTDTDSDVQENSLSNEDQGYVFFNEDIGGAPIVHEIKDNELSRGYRIALSNGDRISFKHNNESHFVQMQRFNNNASDYSVKIIIMSNPRYILLREGEQEKIDYEDDGIYDLVVRFEEVNQGFKPRVFIKNISEKKIINASVELSQEINEEEIDRGFLKKMLKYNKTLFWKITILHLCLVILLVVVLLAILYFFYKSIAIEGSENEHDIKGSNNKNKEMRDKKNKIEAK